MFLFGKYETSVRPVVGNSTEIVNVCLISESRHGRGSTNREILSALFDAGVNICPYVTSAFYACNTAAQPEHGNACANFQPFTPLTYNPYKRENAYELIGSK